jgi:hypothetical protein
MTQAANLGALGTGASSSGVLAATNGGTGVTTSTGSGNNVLSTSPTLVTPALGTPSSVVLTNATGLSKSALPSGSILQVVSYTNTTQSSYAGASTSPQAIWTLASFTPTSATSKVLLTLNMWIGKGNNETFWVTRNSTYIGGAGKTSSYNNPNAFWSSDEAIATNVYVLAPLPWTYLDSPGTTSALTYIFGCTLSNPGGYYFNQPAQDTNAGAGTSTWTLMEIAA